MSNTRAVMYDNESGIAFLAPANLKRDLDFSATTLGVHSKCYARGAECSLSRVDNNTVSQSCLRNGWGSELLTTQSAYNTSLQFVKDAPNPFTYWIWVVVDQTWSEYQSGLTDDPEILELQDAISIIAECEVGVANVTYSIRNGTLDAASLLSLPVEDPLTYVVADPMALNFPQNQLYEHLRLAAATTTSSHGIMEVLSRRLSEFAIGYTAGLFEPWPNSEEATRIETQVTRLPAALVWLMVSLGYIISLEGILLLIKAISVVYHN